jgi:hypothetical protein
MKDLEEPSMRAHGAPRAIGERSSGLASTADRAAVDKAGVRAWIFRHRARLKQILRLGTDAPPLRSERRKGPRARSIERRGEIVWLRVPSRAVEGRRRAG